VKRSSLAWLPILFLSIPSWAALFGSEGPDYSANAGNIYICASTGTVQTQAGVSQSSPTLSLFNPPNSGKNLVLLNVGLDVTASPAAAAQFSLAYNAPISSGIAAGSGAAGTVTPALIGKSSTTVKGICMTQGILPATPTEFYYLGGTMGAAAIGGTTLTDYTQGKVVLPPGSLVSLQASSLTQLRAHLEWREDNQ
jgi:hypothetical protein